MHILPKAALSGGGDGVCDSACRLLYRYIKLLWISMQAALTSAPVFAVVVHSKCSASALLDGYWTSTG
jgi:hypothetical protein